MLIHSLLTGFAIVSALATAEPIPRSVSNYPVIQTTRGSVQGVASEYRDGITVYKGIPFAASTAGENRWKAPSAREPWTGVLKADSFGPQCAQTTSSTAGTFNTASSTTSEDCLYLNIWTPTYNSTVDLPSKKLPVYVWIYGGRFEAGSGDVATYHGSGLASKGIFVVTLNYRVGAFGFLAHPALSAESGHNSSGNYGLLDQQFALRWVKENIANFGGNPDQVTVGGQSAGSASSLDMMYSPLSKDLINGVILEKRFILQLLMSCHGRTGGLGFSLARTILGHQGICESQKPSIAQPKENMSAAGTIAALVELEPDFRHGPNGAIPNYDEIDGRRCLTEDTTGLAGELPQYVTMCGSLFGKLNRIRDEKIFDEGCREIHERMEPFMPLDQQHQQRIGISTIRIGARSFISGLNLFPPVESSVVGLLLRYRIPTSEKWIEIPSTFPITALHVAFCREGITGVKLKFANSTSSSWIGDIDGPGIVQRTLSIPNNFERLCLFAHLDRFKINELSLGDLTEHPRRAPQRHPQAGTDSSRLPLDHWTPHLPTHRGLEFSALLSLLPPVPCALLTNVDFGGPEGLLLKSLTMLTFYMSEGPRPFIGVEIFYSDRESTLFGSNRGCGISFPINGPRGERITEVHILDERNEQGVIAPEVGLGGIQVSAQNTTRTSVIVAGR